MAFLRFKNCCCCINLGKGAWIIAIVTLVCECISLIISSFFAKYKTEEYYKNVTKDGKMNASASYIYAQKFFVFLFILIVCFKVLLSIALLIGLFKRLPDHLEMWYKGYMLCILLQVAIAACASINEFKKNKPIYWFIISERFVVTSVTLYFVIMIRNYYFEMCKEVNYYQNIIYTQNDTKGNILFSDRPPRNEESFYETIPSQKNFGESNTVPPKHVLFKKGGGEVYSSPKHLSMVMPMPVEVHTRQSSTLYPSLV